MTKREVKFISESERPTKSYRARGPATPLQTTYLSRLAIDVNRGTYYTTELRPVWSRLLDSKPLSHNFFIAFQQLSQSEAHVAAIRITKATTKITRLKRRIQWFSAYAVALRS